MIMGMGSRSTHAFYAHNQTHINKQLLVTIY
jgi:hypothetical protein